MSDISLLNHWLYKLLLCYLINLDILGKILFLLFHRIYLFRFFNTKHNHPMNDFETPAVYTIVTISCNIKENTYTWTLSAEWHFYFWYLKSGFDFHFSVRSEFFSRRCLFVSARRQNLTLVAPAWYPDQKGAFNVQFISPAAELSLFSSIGRTPWIHIVQEVTKSILLSPDHNN